MTSYRGASSVRSPLPRVPRGWESEVPPGRALRCCKKSPVLSGVPLSTTSCCTCSRRRLVQGMAGLCIFPRSPSARWMTRFCLPVSEGRHHGTAEGGQQGLPRRHRGAAEVLPHPGHSEERDVGAPRGSAQREHQNRRTAPGGRGRPGPEKQGQSTSSRTNPKRAHIESPRRQRRAQEELP